MIETELKSEKGKLATQFIMGQRYIEALGKQARPDNLFLVRQGVDAVPEQVSTSINLLNLRNIGDEDGTNSNGGNGNGTTTTKARGRPRKTPTEGAAERNDE